MAIPPNTQVALVHPSSPSCHHGMTGVTTGKVSGSHKHQVIQVRLSSGRVMVFDKDELYFPGHPDGYNQEINKEGRGALVRIRGTHTCVSKEARARTIDSSMKLRVLHSRGIRSLVTRVSPPDKSNFVMWVMSSRLLPANVY